MKVLFLFLLSIMSLNTVGQSPYPLPIPQDWYPFKNMRLIIHVFNTVDSSYNFNRTPSVLNYFSTAANHVNYMYNEPKATVKYDSIVYDSLLVSTTKIFWRVDTILFHYNNGDARFDSATRVIRGGKEAHDRSKARRHCEQIYKKYVKDNDDMLPVQKDSSLHPFLFEYQGMEGRGMASSFSTNRWTYAIGAYAGYQEPEKPNHWLPAAVWAHELAHAIGLYHPYNGHNAKDLPSSPRGATNNIMDAWPRGPGISWTNHQISLVHQYIEDSTKAISKIWDRKLSEFEKDVIVQKDQQVNLELVLYAQGDIVVEDGGMLIVNRPLFLKDDAKISVRNGGTLIVNSQIRYSSGQDALAVQLAHQQRFLFFFKKRKKPLLVNRGYISGITTE